MSTKCGCILCCLILFYSQIVVAVSVEATQYVGKHHNSLVLFWQLETFHMAYLILQVKKLQLRSKQNHLQCLFGIFSLGEYSLKESGSRTSMSRSLSLQPIPCSISLFGSSVFLCFTFICLSCVLLS